MSQQVVGVSILLTGRSYEYLLPTEEENFARLK